MLEKLQRPGRCKFLSNSARNCASGSFFVTDLIGCSVFEVATAASSLIGAPALAGESARRLFPGPGAQLPGTPLLAVDTSRGELLVPLAEDICTAIEITARRIEVRLPEGLREL